MSVLRQMGLPLPEESKEEELVYALGRAYNFVEEGVSDALKPFKLSPTSFNVLMVAKHVGGKEGLSQMQISKGTLVHRSNLTSIIDRLEKRGLLQRTAHATDRRTNVIKITPKGSKLLDEAWPSYLKRVKDLSRDLNQSESRALSGLLSSWASRLTVKRGRS